MQSHHTYTTTLPQKDAKTFKANMSKLLPRSAGNIVMVPKPDGRVITTLFGLTPDNVQLCRDSDPSTLRGRIFIYLQERYSKLPLFTENTYEKKLLSKALSCWLSPLPFIDHDKQIYLIMVEYGSCASFMMYDFKKLSHKLNTNQKLNLTFLDTVDKVVKHNILESIKNHYDSYSHVSQVYGEVISEDAEHLLDYLPSSDRTATSVLMQKHGMRYLEA